MKAETGAALEALYLKWKNPPRYLELEEDLAGQLKATLMFGETTTAEERAELRRTFVRINAERKQKYEDEVEQLAEEFVNKWREDWLCD